MKSLPQSYLNEINHNEKIDESEVKAKIDLMDMILNQAKELRKQGDHHTADMLCESASKHFDEFRKSHSLYDDLTKQREKYEGDLDNLAQLKQDADAHDALIESKKSELNTLQDEKTKKWQKIKELEGVLDKSEIKESPHAGYRNSMVDYAKENDKDHAERIEKRAARVEELRIKGLIKEDADGVSFGGLKTASKAVQDKALQDAFGDILQSSYGREDHQGEKSGTKKVFKKDLDAHGDQFGEFALGSMAQLDTMRARIRENFDDVNTQDDELYILQMINPGLFEGMRMKDVSGNCRSYLKLKRDVNDSHLDENFSHYYKAGLFLVQNV